MVKINNSKELKEVIRLLEIDRADKLDLLKEETHTVLESLKPTNFIKDVLESPNIKEAALDGLLGLVTGYVSKKILVGGTSSNPIKNIFGNLIQFGIAKLVSKNATEIKTTGKSLLRSLLSKRKEL